jgi:hypothetical protein
VHGEWQDSPWLDEGVSYHRKANITKTMRRLEEYEPNAPIMLRFLTIACAERKLPPGTMVRLERWYYVLPKASHPFSRAEWQAFEPEWTTNTMAETSCPETL